MRGGGREGGSVNESERVSEREISVASLIVCMCNIFLVWEYPAEWSSPLDDPQRAAVGAGRGDWCSGVSSLASRFWAI
jgi:hypothetical protein